VTPQVFSDGARVIGKDGKVIAGNARFGAGWPEDLAEVNSVLREGTGPTTPGQVAINAQLAKAGGFKVGDTIEVITLQPRKPFTVTGIVGVEGGRDSLGGETIVYFTMPVAQELMLNAPGSYSNVDLKAAPGVTPEQLKQRTIATVGEGYTVRTGKETAQAQQSMINTFLNVFSTGLAVFGFLALFTGAFLIFNTFSMLIAQRTRELALYRSFGANRGQVLRSVVLESLVVGLTASIIGLAIGVGLGWLLKKLLGALGGGGLPGSGVVLRPYVVVLTLLAGTLITMFAAFIPALRAARVGADRGDARGGQARQAVAPHDVRRPRPRRRRRHACCFSRAPRRSPTRCRRLAAACCWCSSAPCSWRPRSAAPSPPRSAGSSAGRCRGASAYATPAATLAATALTAAALMIGVTLATGAGVFAASTKAGLNNVFKQDLKADLLLQTDFTAGPTAGFDPALDAKMRAIPGVTDVAVIQADQVRLAVAPSPPSPPTPAPPPNSSRSIPPPARSARSPRVRWSCPRRLRMTTTFPSGARASCRPRAAQRIS
jgi:putative ABC transport system permease protein